MKAKSTPQKEVSENSEPALLEKKPKSRGRSRNKNAASPEPAPVEPEPAPVEPEPAPVEAEPAPVEAEPAPIEAEPAPVEPAPAPVDTKLTSKQSYLTRDVAAKWRSCISEAEHHAVSFYDLFKSQSPEVKTAALCAANYALNAGLPDSYVAMALVYRLGEVIGKRIGVPDCLLSGPMYPLGCPFEVESIEDGHLMSQNTDMRHGVYSCGAGIYRAQCGFQALEWFGASEILWQCLQLSCQQFPDWALYVLRFYDFKAWHIKSSYARYADRIDNNYLQNINMFVRCLNQVCEMPSQSDIDLIHSMTSEMLPVGIFIPKARM